MEDDEEILSHTSHDSEEPQQQVLEEDGEQEEEDEEEGRGIEIEIPNSNSNSNLNQSPPSGRITVTVAAAPPPSASSSLALVPMASPASATPTTMTANTPSTPPVPLAIALPIQNPAARPGGAVGGSGGGREDCWSEGATSVLIDAWGERYMELSRGNLKQKHWKEVADIVNNKADYGKTPKTDIQCKNRIDTVKKKYKTEKTKVSTGCGPSRWPFYERLERLIGPTANSAVKTPGGAVPTASVSTGINNNQKAVPVGIPVGIRQPLSLPFPPYSSPHLHPPPHLQSPPQQQQQPIRHFPSPISQQQRFSVNLNNNNNNVGRHQLLLHQQHKQQQYLHLQQQQQQQQQQQFRRGPMMAHPPPVDSDSEQEGWSNDSEDSLPPSIGYDRRKRPGPGSGMRVSSSGVKKGKGKKALKLWGNSVRELTKAILKFGEAYETAESAKLQHIMEMEKQRMKFAKELELQRMKFLMKTQLELSQFNGGNGNGNGSGNGNSDSRGGASSGRRGGESNHMHQLNHQNENHLTNNNNHANSDSSN